MLSSLPSLSRLSHLAGGSSDPSSQPQQQQQQQSQQQQQQQPLYPQLPNGQQYQQSQQSQYGYGGSGGQVQSQQPQGQIGYGQQYNGGGTQGYNPYAVSQAPAYNQGPGYGGGGGVVQQYQQPGSVQGQGQALYQSQQPQSSINLRYPTAGISQTQLSPQPLESVSKDEDPVYGPLGRARGKVERAMVADNEISPDLIDGFGHPANHSEPYVAPPGNTNAFKCCRLTRRTPLPDELHQELNYKHLTAKMGLFPEIERAWFTVDNKLFLWDYSDGRDFSRYDEQDDTIQAVGLVRVRKDVFVDDITHVLVICTSAKATLLGLSRPSNSREINLWATNLSVDTPTAMIDIKGTAAGRIFMLGANKDLYELDYSAKDSWLFGSATSIKVHNRSSGNMANWLPSVLASNSKEGVESFVIDEQRSRLFALFTNGDIEWFDIAGTKFETRSRYPVSRLKQLFNVQAVKIVSIAIVGRHESQRAGLVAITSTGNRIYFETSMSFGIPHARSPPSLSSTPLATQSFYSSGTFIAVQHDTAAPLPQTHLTFTIPHSGRQSALRENYEAFEAPAFQEWTTTELIPSQVWSIVELPSTNPANSPPSLTKSDGIALNPLARQATTEARGFLVLATSGLFWVNQPRPIDMLQSDLELEKEIAISAVRTTFGKNQIAAMSLVLGSETDLKQAEVASAVSTILLSSGDPIIKDSTGGKIISYSARHEGLALAIARYLRPIWNVKVTVPVVGGRLVLAIPESPLLAVQGRLEKLRRYLDDHPFQRYQTEGDAKIAWDQEEMSLHGLQVLLKQAVEAISFILLLSDYKMSDIIAKTDMGTQQTLSNLTFQSFLTSLDGKDVAKRLVTALIEQQIGQELGIDTLSEILQQRCGTFCQPGDVVMYKAEESMRRAEASRDFSDRNESLAESLRLFTRAAGSIPVSRLHEVSKRYRALQYINGAIELPLKTAIDLDPSDKAVDFVRDGSHPSDPRKALFEARKECYEMVIEALQMFDEMLDKTVVNGDSSAAIQKRDEAYALAIASDDELFHFYLYDWHVKRGLQEQLLEFDTPYIERYLQLTSNDLEDRRDLLWKFYARRHDFLPAAQALSTLATRPSPMVLHDRLYYLAQALTSAKSAASLGSEDVEFTSRLQEQIDVAQVQMEVARAVELHPEMSADEKNDVLAGLNTSLLQLDELYQNFARPLRLYEPILLILKTADTRLDEVCEAVWKQLLSQYGRGSSAALGEAVRNLARRYFPSEAAPLDIMVPVVYAEATGCEGGEPGWVSQALLEGGVPLRDLWEAVTGLYENSDDEEREYYAGEISVLAAKWVDRRDEIPAAEVERFASAYLLRTNGAQGDEARRATRERFTTAKQAAVRY
ncbi:hypothetical protein CI109_106577 [Kwoniella shandongensis]|uniref:Uncharacterized protein n=1 Tax=Kwoniella shandongensis TaxID=1734106 RepID=A0A5M6C2Q9_9TREE|nr:uncharacterized protein CI109_002759 [Kwoniella shandongensis]KAA5529001.1 hypothetical protein CI109_002759 [Kwoniella shandongensis]